MKQSLKYGQKIKALTAEAQKIHKFAEDQGREVTAEESKNVDDILAQVDALKKSIAQLKSVEDAEAEVDAEEVVESSKKVSAGRYSRPDVGNVIHQDVQKYSLLRAINCFMEKGRVDGLEGEINQEYAKKLGKSAQGFYMLPLATYGNLDTTTGAGAVQTVKQPENFIELLRSKTLANELGVKFLSDLSGNISIPKQTGGATAYWINSDGSSTLTVSNQTIGQVPLVPNTCGAYSYFTRQFLKQTGMDAESFIRNDLANVLALELDRVIFNGSGSGAEPEGVLNNSSVTTVALGTSGGAPTFPKTVELETNVSAGNADVGNLAYVTTPQGRGKLKTTEINSNTAGIMICKDNEVNGYKLYASNQLPHNLTKGPYGTGLSPMIFGNWADIVVGLWGPPDILVNPYEKDAYGSVKVTIMEELDVALRNTESFSKIVDMLTA